MVSSDVSVTLLGGFRLSVNGRPVFLAPAAQRPIALLALESRPVLRLYVAGQLWPDFPENRALGNLRSALWRLRQQGLDIIHSDSQHLRLTPSVLADVPEVIEVARRLVQPEAKCVESDFQTARFRGELLPDWYDDWLILERERLRQLCLHALEAMANRLVNARRYAEAVDAALIAISLEPYRETAHRALIQAYLSEGNRREAAQHYRRFRKTMAEELNSVPSPELQKLGASLLSH